MNERSNETAYPYSLVENAHADPGVVAFFDELYAAKKSDSADRFASRFSADLFTYTDAVLGWENASHAALQKVMPNWAADGPTRPASSVVPRAP